MRLRSHIGTLLFPPVALVYGVYSFTAFGRSHAAMLLTFTLIIMTILAIGSRRFFLTNPSCGVFFFGSLLLLFPFSQRVTSDDVIQFMFGALTVVGGVGGVLFYGMKLIRQSFRREEARRGFDVLPLESAKFGPSVLQDKPQ